MKTAHRKGRELEEAVYFIQKTILESDPRYRGQKFTISRNQILRVNGVRHEVDVFVCVSPETDFESKFLFECKNLKGTVGKNEVIVLSEKVRSLSATRGFLVAHAFSADAEAQARTDPRIRLVPFRSDFSSPLSFELINQETDLLNVEVNARIIGKDGAAVASGDLLPQEIWMFQGLPMRLAEVVHRHADHFYREHFKAEQSRLRLEGTHFGVAPGQVNYDRDELTCGDRMMEWMRLVCHYRVVNRARRVQSRFEMTGYGTTYSFEPIQAEGKAIEVVMVMRQA